MLCPHFIDFFSYQFLDSGNVITGFTLKNDSAILEQYSQFIKYAKLGQWYIISYPLFADADTGIYPHAASQYHARPNAKRGIAMLSVDKFPYPRKQARGNEFIPCSNNICDILKRFRSFKIPVITLIWPKLSYKHSVTRSYRSGKESWRNRHCDVINDVPLSLYLTLMTSNVRYGSIFHGC